jgi:hypothetical protein
MDLLKRAIFAALEVLGEGLQIFCELQKHRKIV